MSILVRRATLEDLDALTPLFASYRVFYAQPYEPDVAREFLRERIAHGESVVLLAESDGKPAGFVQLYPMFSSVRTARIYILNDLFVAAHARRQGVARMLLDAAAAAARELGALRIVLETTRDNAPARALYRTAGWEEDATQWYSLSLSLSLS